MNDDLIAQMSEQEETIQRLQREHSRLRDLVLDMEDVIHRAAKISGHISFLCESVEGSEPIAVANYQLHAILTRRQ